MGASGVEDALATAPEHLVTGACRIEAAGRGCSAPHPGGPQKALRQGVDAELSAVVALFQAFDGALCFGRGCGRGVAQVLEGETRIEDALRAALRGGKGAHQILIKEGGP